MLERTLEGDPFLIRQGSDMEARSDRLSGGGGGGGRGRIHAEGTGSHGPEGKALSPQAGLVCRG